MTDHLPAADLDMGKLGEFLFRLPMISASMGHEAAHGTCRDYLAPHADRLDCAEARFVLDVLTRPTQEVCDRWFGGEANAALIITRSREWGGEAA